MKKYLSVILVLVLVFALSACAEKPAEETSSDTPSQEITIDLNALKNSIIEKAELVEPLEIDLENFCERYDVDASDVSDLVYITTLNGTFPDEIIIVKSANGDAKMRITEKFSSRLDEVKVQSRDYDAENYALAQECKIIEKDSYLALFISAKHAQMEKIFEESFNS